MNQRWAIRLLLSLLLCWAATGTAWAAEASEFCGAKAVPPELVCPRTHAETCLCFWHSRSSLAQSADGWTAVLPFEILVPQPPRPPLRRPAGQPEDWTPPGEFAPSVPTPPPQVGTAGPCSVPRAA